MSDSQQKPDVTNPRPVVLDLEFAKSYFVPGAPRDSFIIATKEGEEVMIAQKCSDGTTRFEPMLPEHAYTAATFSKVYLHYDTLAKMVRE